MESVREPGIHTIITKQVPNSIK